MQDIGRVPDIRDGERPELGKVLNFFPSAGFHRGFQMREVLLCFGCAEFVCVFVEGKEVCEDLCGMPEGREGVYDRDGRVFCKFLRTFGYTVPFALKGRYKLTSISE